MADTHAQASRPATPVDVSVYRAALYLCPPAFRREFAPQMIRDFDEARREAAASGDARRRLWPFRARMTGDLVKTAVWQWLRTGWPAIVALAMTTSLAAAAALASLWPRAVFPLSLDSPDADVIALSLLVGILFVVIALTIIITLGFTPRLRLHRRR